jgi:NTP pyrophosphatase (non-canonical NTP hydrolase)
MSIKTCECSVADVCPNGRIGSEPRCKILIRDEVNETFEAFVQCIRKELRRARAKFPSQSAGRTMAALTEEVGELAQALLKYSGEGKTKTQQDVLDEAVQVCVMAIRVVFDTDMTLE